jgi:Cft2 family RNA processing exonuclease
LKISDWRFQIEVLWVETCGSKGLEIFHLNLQSEIAPGRKDLAYIQFLGAAGTVTGSKHLVNTSLDPGGKAGFQLLIDWGMFQGAKEWRERNWQPMPIAASGIDAVILTHAHLDHCGWIPRLVREGFRGPIYATPSTIDLCGIILPDSGHLQEEDANFYNRHKKSKHHPALPLYTLAEAEASLQYFQPVQFEEARQILRDIESLDGHAHPGICNGGTCAEYEWSIKKALIHRRHRPRP